MAQRANSRHELLMYRQTGQTEVVRRREEGIGTSLLKNNFAARTRTVSG